MPCNNLYPKWDKPACKMQLQAILGPEKWKNFSRPWLLTSSSARANQFSAVKISASEITLESSPKCSVPFVHVGAEVAITSIPFFPFWLWKQAQKSVMEIEERSQQSFSKKQNWRLFYFHGWLQRSAWHTASCVTHMLSRYMHTSSVALPWGSGTVQPENNLPNKRKAET